MTGNGVPNEEVCYERLLLLGFVNLLVSAAFVVAEDTKLCRCEAFYEHLYSRRLAYYQYDYSRTHINDDDDDGYYIIDGIRVLPSYDEACVKHFGNHRSLEEVATDDTDVEPMRALRSKGMSKSNSKNMKKYFEFVYSLVSKIP